MHLILRTLPFCCILENKMESSEIVSDGATHDFNIYLQRYVAGICNYTPVVVDYITATNVTCGSGYETRHFALCERSN